MRDLEDRLGSFAPVRPAPALKERVLAAAGAELRRTWVDRLWTGPTWTALAAVLLLSVTLLWASNRPPSALESIEAGPGPRKLKVPRPSAPEAAPAPAPLPERWLLPFHYFPGGP